MDITRLSKLTNEIEISGIANYVKRIQGTIDGDKLKIPLQEFEGFDSDGFWTGTIEGEGYFNEGDQTLFFIYSETEPNVVT